MIRAIVIGLVLLGGQAWAVQPTKLLCGGVQALLTNGAAPGAGTNALRVAQNYDALGMQYVEAAGTSTVEMQYCCPLTTADCDMTTGAWAQVAGSAKSLDVGSTRTDGAGVDNPFDGCWYRASVTACAGCEVDVVASCVPK